MEKITSALEKGEYCGGVFLDVQQAFDRVWHPGLLYKIKKSISKYFLILKSYLAERSFAVVQDNNLSAVFPINAGVVQGSILGPFLYSLFTADLPTSNKSVTTSTFADDTSKLFSAGNPQIVVDTLQNELNELHEWSLKWRIVFGPAKSEFVMFTLRTELPPPIYLGGIQIPQKYSTRYLGFHLDARLTFKLHVINKRKQLDMLLRKYYWLLGRGYKLSITSKLLVYKTIIRRVWQYGSSIWGITAPSNLKMIQIAQNKFLRLITNSPIYTYVDILHESANIEYVKEVINRLSIPYFNRLSSHPNHLALSLTDNSETVRRLKRTHVLDLFLTQLDLDA